MNFAKLTTHTIDDSDQEQWVNLDMVQYFKSVTRRKNGVQSTFTRLYLSDKNTIDVKEAPSTIILGAFSVGS